QFGMLVRNQRIQAEMDAKAARSAFWISTPEIAPKAWRTANIATEIGMYAKARVVRMFVLRYIAPTPPLTSSVAKKVATNTAPTCRAITIVERFTGLGRLSSA